MTLTEAITENTLVSVEVSNYVDSPFGGVVVIGGSDDPITQVILREGAQGEPGEPGAPGLPGPAGPAGPDSGGSGSGVTESGFTPLVNGQNYIDVLFESPQADNQWLLTGGFVSNTVDPTPLNVVHGVITSRTTLGFRLQLIGVPDSNNYRIGWGIIGTVAGAGSGASTYSMGGPSSGFKSAASTNFTVSIPTGFTLASPVTITPDDGGAGGTFTPASVVLSTGTTLASFTYTPTTYGAITISATNDGSLEDPLGLSFTSKAAAYTFTGPAAGSISVASTNFTVALPVGGAVLGTVTVTPSDGGAGGTFTPATIDLTTVAPSVTFTYTPVTGGPKTLSLTNNGGMTNPGNLTYASIVDPSAITGMRAWWRAEGAAATDGDAVGVVYDSSGVGNNLFGGDSTYKTNIINGKPVLRFDGINDGFAANNPMPTQPGTIFVVAKPGATVATHLMVGDNSTYTQFVVDASGFFLIHGGTYLTDAIDHRGAFHVFTGKFNGASSAIYVDGVQTASGNAGSNGFANMGLMNNTLYAGSTYSSGDIAEIIAYNSALSDTDRANVENFLKSKYALP